MTGINSNNPGIVNNVGAAGGVNKSKAGNTKDGIGALASVMQGIAGNDKTTADTQLASAIGESLGSNTPDKIDALAA